LLRENFALRPLLCNRSRRASERGIKPLSTLSQILTQADAAIVCTGASSPVITAGMVPDRKLLLVDIGIPQQVERGALPSKVQLVGLDELVQFHQRRQKISSPRLAEAERLVDRAVEEFHAFCQEVTLAGILSELQHQQRSLLKEEIPQLLQQKFSGLAPRTREQLVGEIRALVLQYTGEIYNIFHRALCQDFNHSARANAGDRE